MDAEVDLNTGEVIYIHEGNIRCIECGRIDSDIKIIEDQKFFRKEIE